jgi:hypothetical protein
VQKKCFSQVSNYNVLGQDLTSQTVAPNRLLASELKRIAKLPLASLRLELNRADFLGGGRFILTSLAEGPCSPDAQECWQSIDGWRDLV